MVAPPTPVGGTDRGRSGSRSPARADSGTGPGEGRHRAPARTATRPGEADQEELWILESLSDERDDDGHRQTLPTPRRPSSRRDRDILPTEVAEELFRIVGSGRGRELAHRLEQAARAYERDRYHEALRLTTPLVGLLPESVAVRELHGLVCYRLGKWREAARQLEAAAALGGDSSQLPVIMDCRRALGQHRKVESLYEELRVSSPPAEVLSEGRLVLAGQRADRGDLEGAIGLLLKAGAARNLRHPDERHIRQWYVLADLYERAGDIPRARELFCRVAEADPELADAPRRLRELGRRATSNTRTRSRSSTTPRRRVVRGSGRSTSRA